MKKLLTIAGSDCSGGAGIQADLKTFAAFGHYGMSAITALTAQNTRGVFGVVEISPEFVASQIDCVFNDIVPDAVKIGMVSSAEIIHTIASKLKAYQPKFVVVDPVMVSTSGSRLLNDDAMTTLISELLPIATLITPNIPEAEALTGQCISTRDDMLEAAKQISKLTPSAILIKGGHLEETADDLLFIDGTFHWFTGCRIQTTNTHGTGCTLSSAIASNLASNLDLIESIADAKAYITGALAAGLDLGQGSGPLYHNFHQPKGKWSV